MQNKILKNLCDLKWDTPKLQLHKNLKLLKVSDVYKMRIIQTVYKHDKSLNNMLLILCFVYQSKPYVT